MHRESRNFDDPVGISCKHGNIALFVCDLRFVLLRYLQFITVSGNQIVAVEKGIINVRDGVSSYICINIYIYIYIF